MTAIAPSVFCDDRPVGQPAMHIARLAGISNFCKVDDGFYRGGYPDNQGLVYLKKIGIKVIIDLRGGKASVSKERREAEALGFKYINIPFGFLYKPPVDSEIRKFLKITTGPLNRPLFVHCQNGRDRTGAMVALYRITVNGWQIENAYSEAKDFGFHPIWRFLRDFILKEAVKFRDKK